MLKNVSAWHIWGLAFSLIALDFILISLFFSQPSVLGINESEWDFRIAELRKLDVEPQTGVAGVQVSRETIDSEPTPTPAPALFSEVLSPPAVKIKPWSMPFGSLLGTQGTTEADKNGQIL